MEMKILQLIKDRGPCDRKDFLVHISGLRWPSLAENLYSLRERGFIQADGTEPLLKKWSLTEAGEARLQRGTLI